MERLDKAALNALQTSDVSEIYLEEKSCLPGKGMRDTERCAALSRKQAVMKYCTKRNESSLASTLKTLLFFTALMITVPIGLYFTTKSYVFEGAFGMSNRDSYFYAAIVAVVAVHVVLALFVYVAWNEGSRQWREGKQD
ncbi:vacuolar ATPase assembly integral membrane protein VMA21 isoform X1 [Pteronotus mesoamericanus]|uniref:vacuolar ATPase assembly integral membrane protein VMA21 isoform X1 n=1 Tax=Pteronotus mesoamericanus TaxID=1884717 RepID=UPI0023EBA090|nr:vacuolar ATPase assembly integral membrane protein VMA21 isoform X1 [Pteronotus parnellii mesoamericanus]